MSHNASRRISTVRQLELLIEFLEPHKDLALGRVQSKEARALSSRLWTECANICNAEGTYRTPKEWNRYWNDLKGRVKTKLRTNNQSTEGTGGGPSTHVVLTPIEDRVAALIGRDVVAPLQGVQQNPFSNQNADEFVEQPPLEQSLQSQIKIEYDVKIERNPVPPISPVATMSFEREEEPQDSAGQPAEFSSNTQDRRSRRRQNRPRVQRQLLSQEVGNSQKKSRSAFIRLQEAKIAAQAQKLRIEENKVKALEQIASAINKLADVVSSACNHTPQEGRPSGTKRRRTSSNESN